MENTTPTERRLAITPGEAKHYGDGYVEVRRGDRMAIRFNPEGYTPGQQGFIQSVDDAALYADAHNTYNSCDILPSELLAKLQAITTEIQGAQVSIQRTHDQDHTRYAVVDLDDWHRILAKLNLNLPKP